MSSQTIHKISVIALLLVAFAVPFYLQRNVIDSSNTRAYLSGAVVSTSKASTTNVQNTNPNSYNSSAMTDAIGNTFISSGSN